MARKLRATNPKSTSRSQSGPVDVTKADPKAWSYAKSRAGNRVLRPNKDGSVTITNKIRKGRPGV